MTSLDGLLGALIGAPALPGARCRGRHRLFDEPSTGEPAEVVRQRHNQALLLCGHCPAQQQCRQWLDGLSPRLRPYGVVAGRVRTRSPRKTKKDNDAPITR